MVDGAIFPGNLASRNRCPRAWLQATGYQHQGCWCQPSPRGRRRATL